MPCDSPMPTRVGPEPEAPAAAPTVPDRGTPLASGSGSCDWVAGLDADSCLRLTVVAGSPSGACAGIDADQVLDLVWDAGDLRWESSADFTVTGSGVSGPAHFGFDEGVPYLTIDGVYGVPAECDGGLLFAFGGPVLCGGTAAECEDVFVARVTCLPCSCGLEAGWYCVWNPETETCTATYLSAIDVCDPDLVLCSGPHADEPTAETACGPVEQVCCPEDPVPPLLYLSLTVTPDYVIPMTGEYWMQYQTAADGNPIGEDCWFAAVGDYDPPVYFVMLCSPPWATDSFAVLMYQYSAFGGENVTLLACEPFSGSGSFEFISKTFAFSISTAPP